MVRFTANPVPESWLLQVAPADIVMVEGLERAVRELFGTATRLREGGAHDQAEYLEQLAEPLADHLEAAVDHIEEGERSLEEEVSFEEEASLDHELAILWADYLSWSQGISYRPRGTSDEYYETEVDFAQLIRHLFLEHLRPSQLRDMTDEHLIAAARDAYLRYMQVRRAVR
jgi:hypothetical protein